MHRRIVTRLSRSVWPALAALVALIPFAGGFSTTHVFFVRDLGMYFWPRHLWHSRAWRHGDWPLWDPHAGGGQSAVADALNQFFLIPVTLVRVFTPPNVGFNFWVAAPFPLVAVGTWLWLRRRTSPAASFVGATVASLAGPVVSTGNTPNLSWAVALIPWILWSLDRVCDAPRFTRFAALATCIGVQALAGEPVTFSATSALVVAYAAIAVPFDRWRDGRTRLLHVGAALATGVLLSAIQLAPLLFAVGRSVRAVEIDETFWSLHPLALMETLIPHVFGHAFYGSVDSFPWMMSLNSGREPLFYSLYVGVGACVLAMIGTTGSVERRWRLFWWAVCAVAILCALGRYTFVYPTLQRVVPVLETFRFPIKYLVLSAFAVAALAAGGVDALLAHSRAAGTMRRPAGALTFLGIIGGFTALAGSGGLFGAEWIISIWAAIGHAANLQDPVKGAEWMMQAAGPLWLRLSVLAGVVAFLLALVWRRHRLAPLAAWTLCGVALLDPVSVNQGIHPTMPAARLGPPEWVAATRAHPLDRVYVGGRLRKGTSEAERLDGTSRFPVPFEWQLQEATTLVTIQLAQTPAAWGVRELISYDLPQLWPREYTTMLGKFRETSLESRLRFLRRTGMRYCFLPEPPFSGAAPLIAPPLSDPLVLYECHTDPKRVYVTDSARVEPDLRRQLDLMFDEHHDPYGSVLIERDAPPAAGEPGTAAASSTARIVRERNTEIVVSAAVGASGGYLNLVDSYDPFWHADVDGRPAVLLRANGLFRAVRLAPGAHDVRFYYRPTPFLAGLVITSITGMILMLGCMRARTRRD